ncbi:CHAT domain-containing protein [Streptomyces lomondensis]|nr:CHAT domain-containing protein [Streptomyces lomondensis]
MRSLRHHRTREPAARRGPARLVACAVPRPPGSLQELPGTLREVGMLAELFPGTRVLTGAEVTHDALAAALPTADWAHFACHGRNDGQAPSRSALVLHDHDRAPMTVLDISRMRLPAAEFAYLSACSTMRTGAGLSDEAIHITGAFQLAGYRNVVGTLWNIRDDLAVDMAERVYTPLAHGAPVGDEEIARALHAATTELRARHPGEPAWWAAHVHVGG